MASRRRVLVIPGLAASDGSTQLIRSALTARGHRAHGWRLGVNEGPSEATTTGLTARLNDLYQRNNEPVAVVGWSLGGVYAHWLARSSPQLIHSVITLGSPLGRQGMLPAVLAVPTTSVYSKHDRVVHWSQSLLDERGRNHQNVEVRVGHIGLGFDPAVLHLITDRVGQSRTQWVPYRPPLALRPAFVSQN